MLQIDINCDLGEGYPDDALLMPFISSVNIACGAHAGDEERMRATALMALQHNLHIGAHPGFADRFNFGRVEQYLSDEALYDLLTEQIFLMKKITDELGTSLHHVKPHGALYNMSAKNPAIADIIARAVRDVDAQLCLYGLSGSCSITAATAAGLTNWQEAFADRRYDDAGQLLARSHPAALIKVTASSCQQVLLMVTKQKVISVSGEMVPVQADTICIHGDAPGAAALAATLSDFLQTHHIELRKK